MGWLGGSMGAVTRAAVGLFSGLPTGGVGVQMLQGVLQGSVGAPPRRGTKEFLEAYTRLPLLRSIVGRVAFSVASVPWQVFVVQGKNGKARGDAQIKSLQRCHDPGVRHKAMQIHRQGKELREVLDHPFLDTMDTGNPYQTGLQMRMLLSGSMELVGEAFWMKERRGKVVTGVWPIPAYWVTATPTFDNPSYRVSFRGWQGNIPDTEIVWFQDPDYSNPYWRGTGVAQAVTDELETDEYAAKTTKAHFLNRAKPDVLITSPDLGKDEVTRLQTDWLAHHQGFWNAFKPRFMNREVDVHEFQTDFRAGQFVQIRQHERDIIQQTWGVPPEILGIIEHSNRATIHSAEYLYAKLVLVPRLELIRSILQERFVAEWDERLIVDYVSPVEQDREFALAVAQAVPYTRTIDEWRELQGLDALDSGKGKIYSLPTGVEFVEELPVTTKEELAAKKAQAEEMAQLGVEATKLQNEAVAAGNGKPPAAKPSNGKPPADEKPAKAARTVRIRDKTTGRTGTLYLAAGDAVPPEFTELSPPAPATDGYSPHHEAAGLAG
jgi:phage portal protein BeeE